MSNFESNENTEIETINQETVMDNEEQVTEGDEVELEAGASDEVAEGDAKEQKEKAPPAYLSFMAAAEAHAKALGLQTKEQKGFFQIWNATTGHKLYVAKQSKGVTRIDTTLPAEQLPDISYGLEKPNGRIACHVTATTENVVAALDVLASYSEKLPSPKRQAKAEAVPAA